MRFAASDNSDRSVRIHPIRVCRFVVPILTFLVLLLPVKGSQADRLSAPHWWAVSSTDVTEHGQFSELANRHRVYVWTKFDDLRTIDVPSPTSQADVQHEVMQAVSAVRGLQIVGNPSMAEFAILVRTSAATSAGEHEEPGNFSLVLDPSTRISVDIAVLVPGMQMPDGTRRPRMVWDASSPNVKFEAQSAARFMLEGFLSEFRKLNSSSRK